MSIMKTIRWVLVALVIVALLAGAHRIVDQRNRAFFPVGQKTSSMPMH